jgi:hypothetical protein
MRERAGGHDSLVDPDRHPRAPVEEGCESGRIGTIGNRVWGNPPWVQIPLPPPRPGSRFPGPGSGAPPGSLGWTAEVAVPLAEPCVMPAASGHQPPVVGLRCPEAGRALSRGHPRCPRRRRGTRTSCAAPREPGCAPNRCRVVSQQPGSRGPDQRLVAGRQVASWANPPGWATDLMADDIACSLLIAPMEATAS